LLIIPKRRARGLKKSINNSAIKEKDWDVEHIGNNYIGKRTSMNSFVFVAEEIQCSKGTRRK